MNSNLRCPKTYYLVSLLLAMVTSYLLPAAAQGGPSFALGTGSQPKVLVDDSGTARVVWTTYDDSAGDPIQYCRIPRGSRGCDGGPVTLRPPGRGLTSLAILRSGDTIHIVAYRGSQVQIFVNSFPASGAPGSSWREAGDLDFDDIVLGPSNRLFAVGRVNEAAYVQALSTDPPVRTDSSASVSPSFSPAASAIGMAGNTPVAAFSDRGKVESFRYLGPGTSTGDYNTSAKWSGPSPIIPQPGHTWGVALAGGPSGLFAFLSADVGADNATELRAHKWNGSAFGPPVRVGPPGEAGAQYDLFQHPTTGALYAAWRDESYPAAKLRLSRSVDGGASWSAAVDLAPSTGAHHIYEVQLGAASDGQGLAVFEGKGAGDLNFAIRASTLEPLPSGATPPPSPPPDTTAPVIDNHSMARRRFAVVGARTPRGKRPSRRGSAFRFRLSEDASVGFTIERVLRGRRSTRSPRACLPDEPRFRKRPRCTRYKRVGAFRRRGRQGPNNLTFSGRIGRALKPGRYRASLRATDAAGNRSRIRYLDLQVARY